MARLDALNHGLFVVDDLDINPIAASVVGAFAAGAGFVGVVVGGADNVAATVAGNDLCGGGRHGYFWGGLICGVGGNGLGATFKEWVWRRYATFPPILFGNLLIFMKMSDSEIQPMNTGS